MSVPHSKPRIVASCEPERRDRRAPPSEFFVPETRLVSERPAASFGHPVRYATKIRVARFPPEGSSAAPRVSTQARAAGATRGDHGILEMSWRLLPVAFALWGIGAAILWQLDTSVLSGYTVPLKATPFLSAPVLAASLVARSRLRWSPASSESHLIAQRCAGAATGLSLTSLVLSGIGLAFLYTEAFGALGGFGGVFTARLTLDGSAIAIVLAGAATSLLLWALLLLSEDRPRLLSRLVALLPVLLCGWITVRETLEFLLLRLALDPWGVLMLSSTLRAYTFPLFVAAGAGLAVVLLFPLTLRGKARRMPRSAETWTAEAESMRTW